MARTKTLLEETRSLLGKDKRNLMELSKAAGVNYFWLRQFKAGKIRNPGILHVQSLHVILTRTK